MDSLDDLPIDENVELSDKNTEILKRYFGDDIENESILSYKIKILIFSIVTFLILSNPIVKGVIRYTPIIGGGEIKYTIVSTMIFSVIMLTVIYGDEYSF